MQDMFGDGIRRPVAKEALTLVYEVEWKSPGTGKAYQMPSCMEQMHANTLLQVPGDGTNEFRGGLDWKRRDLEPGLGILGDVLRRKLDEVVEVPADFVELSRHGEQDLAELLQALLQHKVSSTLRRVQYLGARWYPTTYSIRIPTWYSTS